MPHPYDDLDAETRAALLLSRDELLGRLGDRAEVFPSNQDMVRAFADRILSDFRECRAAGRDRVAMIVPVGPVGQYGYLAERCLAEDLSLDRLTLIVMDEYLTDDGRLISEDDPLSFRAHMKRNLTDLLPQAMRPTIVIPDPSDPDAIGREIERLGGVDVAFAGVGITGHLAFNEPMPDTEVDDFADLPTRVLHLLPETRLINAVTAARGNVARIPQTAVTIGMREVLGARKLRLYMNRVWQAAAIRRLAFGPVTAAFPASLVQNHPAWSLHIVDYVLEQLETELA